MDNITSLCQRFDEGVDSGAIRMTVDHDCGHAYNGWTGQLLDILEGLVENLPQEDQDQWEEHTNERLSEDDPGLICVPEYLNTLIMEAGGTESDRITSCDDDCSGMDATHSGHTVEETCEYLQSFMNQLEEMDPENITHDRAWYRFDLMKAYIKANQK